MLKRFALGVTLVLVCLGILIMVKQGQTASPPIEGLAGAISVVKSTDAGGHLYVAGRDDNAIALFQGNADGSLSFVQAYYDDQGGIDGLHYVSEIALSPDNKHLYAVGRLDNALAVFSRDATTGALTFVEALKDDVNGVDGLHEASGVVVSLDGKHVYATAGHDSQIAIFSRDATTGKLTYVGVLTDGEGGIDGIGGSFPIIVSPDDAYVYVGGGTDHTIAVFTRNATTGALGPVQVITAGDNDERGLKGISGLAISPDGESVYAASWGGGQGVGDASTIAVFDRDPATGQLAFLELHRGPDGGGTVAGLWGALAVDVSQDGQNLYATGLVGDAVIAFTRNTTTGALTHIQSVVNDGNQGLFYPRDVIVAPGGKNVYAISRVDAAVVWFQRSTDGSLVFKDHYRKPFGLVHGPQKGLTNQSYQFTTRLQGSPPFAYNFEASDGQTISFTGNQTSTVTFRWATPGTKTVALTATNRDGVFSQTLTLDIRNSFTAADRSAVQATGQTTCYNAEGTAIACDGTGQNGDNPTGSDLASPRFIKGNGVVTDTMTGLVWLQNADCIRTVYPEFDPPVSPSTLSDGRITWQQGLTFVKGINNGTYANCGASYTDWRMPNIRELQSLVDFGIGTPVVPNTAGTGPWTAGDPFDNLASSFYWSSTTDEGIPGSLRIDGTTWRAWGTNMQTGASWADDKGGSGAIFKQPMGHLWPVRGQTSGDTPVARTGQQTCYNPQGIAAVSPGNAIPCEGTGQDGALQAGMPLPSPRFITGNGVVTDTLTGLVWLQNADCMRTKYPTFDTNRTAGDGVVTWQMGLDFVNGINNGTYPECSAGYDRWRLPNVRELQSLVDYSLGGPIVPNTNGLGKWSAGNPFINLANTLYWSSTSDAHDPATSAGRAWAIGIRSGAVWADIKNGTGTDMGFPMGRVWPVLEPDPTVYSYLPFVIGK